LADFALLLAVAAAFPALSQIAPALAVIALKM
jgi:hypothetical protein